MSLSLRNAALAVPLLLSGAALAQDEPTPEPLEAVEEAPELVEIEEVSSRAPIVFAMADRFTVEEEINDLYAFAQQISLKSGVRDNAFAFAQQIVVEEGETLEGDLFAFAQSVNIRGNVEGDVYAFAADIYVHPESRIGGDVLFGGANVDFEGQVEGDVQGAGGNLILDGTFGGDLELQTGNLVVGDDADIAGALHYTSETEASIPSDAKIAGGVEFTQEIPEIQIETEPDPEPSFIGGMIGAMVWKTWTFIGSLIVGFTALFLGGTAAARPGRALKENAPLVVGVGFVVACMVPVLSTFAILTVVPLPLGVIGFTAYAIGLYLARLVAGQALGDFILTRMRPDAIGSPYISMTIGVAALAILTSIPILGFLIWMCAVVAGFGGIAMAVYEARTA